jgi:hypothetical protein
MFTAVHHYLNAPHTLPVFPHQWDACWHWIPRPRFPGLHSGIRGRVSW